VAEQSRNSRPSRDTGRTGGRPASGGKSSGGKPPAGGGAAGGQRRSSGQSSERSQKWSPDDKRPARSSEGRPARGGDGKPARGGDRPGRKSDWKRPTDKVVDRSEEQAKYDGPELPAEITGQELDRSISAQLKGLPDKLALRIARHLAAAIAIIDTDPETAYQHTLAARSRAPRLAVVREAAGEAAYAAGHYAEALAELRAAKRMNGATAFLPIMADCHRALGHPEQALKLAKSPSVPNFAPEAKAEMTIVEAGARRDMGQMDAALRTLELAPLMSKSRAPWVVRLRYAYADTLEAAGRDMDALTWFHRTYSIDSEQISDAAERAEILENRRPKD
jgi:tetratricopeptide (TPR) repeat protein